MKPAKKAGDWKEGEIFTGYYYGKVLPEKGKSELITMVKTNTRSEQPTGEVEKLWMCGALKFPFNNPYLKPGMLVEIQCTGFGIKNGNTFPKLDVKTVEKGGKDITLNISKLKDIVDKESPVAIVDDFTDSIDWES